MTHPANPSRRLYIFMSDLLLAPRMKMSLTHASNAPLPSTAKLRGTRHAFEPLTPSPCPSPSLADPQRIRGEREELLCWMGLHAL